MTLDYFYGQAGELFSFFRIPKALFQEQRFQNLSTDAKTLYGILLDRMSLSAKNGWLDKQGRVFIIFTIEDVKRTLCCADNKAMKLFRELEKFGLVERKRRGLGKPSLVYVKNFSSDLSNERVQNRENHESGAFKKECQDPPKSRCNKNKKNKTERNNTNPMPIRSRLPDLVGGYIFTRPERYTSKLTFAAVRGSNIRFQVCTDGLQVFNDKGETAMEFFNSAIEVLQTLVVALGAGLGVWGAINLLEGYGNDNPGSNAHVR